MSENPGAYIKVPAHLHSISRQKRRTKLPPHADVFLFLWRVDETWPIEAVQRTCVKSLSTFCPAGALPQIGAAMPFAGGWSMTPNSLSNSDLPKEPDALMT